MNKIIQKFFSKDKKKGRKKGKTALIILSLILAALAVVTAAVSIKKSRQASSEAKSVRTATATKRDITSELSSSGTISPKDTYDITSLVEGEVVAAEFEEGDTVEKGQVLYQIDTSSMESEMTSIKNSLERSQESYEIALDDYNTALSNYSGNTYKSTENGYIKSLSIKEGDKVSSNTEIASVYDDKTMKIKIPFLSGEASRMAAGNGAVLTLTDTGEQIRGTVSSVSNMDVTLTGGRIVRYVTIEVTNPGGLTTETAATAMVGDFVCSMEATFEPKLETTMKADVSSGVEVGTLLVQEGDYVTKGTPIFTMERKSAERLIRTYKETLEKAEESLETAKSKLESTQDTYDNYTITAPISGKVITKTGKAGDKISKSTNGSTTLAVIYDMSNYTFEMSVDELDVKSVEVGQTVVITADAVTGKTFTGTVSNVSLQSSTSNGVTNYPVTVTLNDGMDELLPGMNVDGVIILDEAKDVLSVPADALVRGNQVYVKDETVKESQGNIPAGFRAVEVTTGLISSDYVEITSGLEENQEVYVAQSTVSNSQNIMIPGGMGGMGGGPAGGGSGVRRSGNGGNGANGG
ncbi:efflux RND transporter periplasmic adaptor subunit [Lacrimispora saccharolytica]|uniref:Secretion protein HlyD family protein n=1 Tax=Lacrimispora saccharolytica (strain ATCC 35040 / DSM 2544 / NRCC 2533 / WM1) TaxID=610130 RepID=D9R284_LACSW|nr:HlyD family efflux transporter periplasmic adaptor subunit [Lacrimispora saccharolytica]ADL04734.1 secretion protein HlyD family protein [[Clostridium] saccharolyticum WM1]QRV21043.1 HlyD family efflux transporter periplasmic adaptor subunit [Lacrimispora saccharolytica]